MTHRERFERFFALPGAHNRDVESVILGAADAFDSALASKQITHEQLEVLVEAVSSPRSGIWQNCCDLLMWASELWLEAAEAILGLSQNTKAHVRFNALCSLGLKTPQAVIDSVLRRGLNDRSARVRWKAADVACSLEQRHLIPEIAEALAVEMNSTAKKAIEFILPFFRDGYILKPKSDGSFYVSIRLSNGGTGIDVSAEELQAKGIDAIVAETRERHDREHAKFLEFCANDGDSPSRG